MNLKKLLCAILTVLLLVSFCACGQEDGESRRRGARSDKSETEETYNNIHVDSITKIGDVAEIEIANVFVTNDVIPPKPSSFYTHYEANDGEVYFVVVMDAKNLGADATAASELVSVTLVLDEKEYSATTLVETDEGASLDRGTSTNVNPLEVARLYQMYSVPDSIDSQNFRLVIENDDVTYSSEFSLSTFESKVKTVNIGETITDDDTISLTIDSVAFETTLYPPKATGYYHYYEADDGKVYLIVKMTVTNLKGSDMKYDTIAGVSCVYNEKYNYSFFTVFEEDGGEDLNGYPGQYAITPLDTGVVYYLAEVPEQVSEGPVEITFYIAGRYYSFSL